MNQKDVVVIALLLWLLWRRPGVNVGMCYVDPDTGECLPVPGSDDAA